MTFRYNVLFFHPLGCVINCAFSRELKFQNKTEKKIPKKKKTLTHIVYNQFIRISKKTQKRIHYSPAIQI